MYGLELLELVSVLGLGFFCEGKELAGAGAKLNALSSGLVCSGLCFVFYFTNYPKESLRTKVSHSGKGKENLQGD